MILEYFAKKVGTKARLFQEKTGKTGNGTGEIKPPQL